MPLQPDQISELLPEHFPDAPKPVPSEQSRVRFRGSLEGIGRPMPRPHHSLYSEVAFPFLPEGVRPTKRSPIGHQQSLPQPRSAISATAADSASDLVGDEIDWQCSVVILADPLGKSRKCDLTQNDQALNDLPLQSKVARTTDPRK